MEHAVMCPQCNAPLAPHRFATSIVCSFCGTTVRLDESSVSASIFHDAFRTWNAPETYQVSSWITIGGRHWALEKMIAQGDISDVYTARLARWPTELVIVKLLRDPQDAGRLDNEWQALQTLHKSSAPGADTFTRLMPQPVVHGDIPAGLFAGRRASIFRWASGFYHTFEAVIQAYPQGIPPRAAIWVWRRILEMLSFIHASGMAHGAVLPENCWFRRTTMACVWSDTALPDGQRKAGAIPPIRTFYPKPPNRDLSMSARCIAAILGGDPETASLPRTVPAQLAEIVRRIALSEPASVPGQNAWAIREELGELAREVFGPPQFIPIVMPLIPDRPAIQINLSTPKRRF